MNHLHNFFQNFESHVVLNTKNFTFLTGGRTKCRRTKCQNMLRWSGQNPNQRMGRTKCQPQKKSGQNANLYLLPNWVYSYGKTHWIAKPKGGSMAKPTVLYRAQSYSKTHWIAKPTGGSMAKPMVLYRAQSYGKTHWMGKAIGESMVKAMEPRL